MLTEKKGSPISVKLYPSTQQALDKLKAQKKRSREFIIEELVRRQLKLTKI